MNTAKWNNEEVKIEVRKLEYREQRVKEPWVG